MRDDELARDLVRVINIIEAMGKALMDASDPRKGFADEAFRLAAFHGAYMDAVHALAKVRHSIELRES